MARVICTLPNASTEISGVKFTEDRGEMISDDISDEVADRLARIPGYKKVEGRQEEPKTEKKGK